MAREKSAPPQADDIPAWFMTYSDVITLLMTFFILLLTFSTTEPERFERFKTTVFSGGNATGIAGDPIEGPENDSWVQRVRPRAARIAMYGAEIPPTKKQASKYSVGEGLMGTTDDENKMETMSTNIFAVKRERIVNNQSQLTPEGAHLGDMLANQLTSLPVHLSLQVANLEQAEMATKFFSHLYEVHQIRPGQIGLCIVDDVSSDEIRFAIERYEK